MRQCLLLPIPFPSTDTSCIPAFVTPLSDSLFGSLLRIPLLPPHFSTIIPTVPSLLLNPLVSTSYLPTLLIAYSRPT